MGSNQPLSREVVVLIGNGLHLRVASRLVTLANTFQSAVWLSSQTRSGSAKSILATLELGASKGEPLTVTVDGPDAETALEAICDFLAGRTPI